MRGCGDIPLSPILHFQMPRQKCKVKSDLDRQMAKQHEVLEALVWGFSCWATWPVGSINRIYRTLRENHPDFGKAISMLQAAIYRIDELDEAAVMQALFDGTLNGTKMSWADINELRGTARWSGNHAKCLKKILYPLAVLVANLEGEGIRGQGSWSGKSESRKWTDSVHAGNKSCCGGS